MNNRALFKGKSCPIAVPTNELVLGICPVAVPTNESLLGICPVAVATNELVLGICPVAVATNESLLGICPIAVAANELVLGKFLGSSPPTHPAIYIPLRRALPMVFIRPSDFASQRFGLSCPSTIPTNGIFGGRNEVFSTIFG